MSLITGRPWSAKARSSGNAGKAGVSSSRPRLCFCSFARAAIVAEQHQPSTSLSSSAASACPTRRGLLSSTSVALGAFLWISSERCALAMGRKSKDGGNSDGSALRGVTLLVDDPAEAATFFATAFGMEVLPVTNGEEETVRVEAGQVVIALQKGRSSASGAEESVLASLGIAVANPAAARASALAAGASRGGGEGLCSGDHLEGCVVRGPGGVVLRMLKDSSVPRGRGRLCRISLNTSSVEDATDFYTSVLRLARLPKQKGVVDRLAEDKPRPKGQSLLAFSSGIVLELCPVVAVQRGQGVLLSLDVLGRNDERESELASLQADGDCNEASCRLLRII